jgi:hypothetical protein
MADSMSTNREADSLSAPDGWPKPPEKNLGNPGDRVCYKCRTMSDGRTLCKKCLEAVTLSFSRSSPAER